MVPELPEVTAHAERIAAAVAGDVLTQVEPLSFAALKTYDPPVDAPVGATVVSVTTRGKHLLLGFGDVTHVVHLMQAGRLRPDPKRSRRPRGGLLRWTFAHGGAWLLTEAGTERKAGVWTVAGDPLAQPPLDSLGPEATDVDAPELLSLFAERSARLHTFLRDQRALAGLGRRLANEVCFRARLSPFAITGSLGPADAQAVVAAIGDAVAASLAEERARGDMGTAADRTSLVHGRTGQDCEVCGDVVREVAYRAYTVHYCATCQTGGKVLADNTLSKLGITDAPPKPRG